MKPDFLQQYQYLKEIAPVNLYTQEHGQVQEETHRQDQCEQQLMCSLCKVPIANNHIELKGMLRYCTR